ncbi:hypothetical protein AWC02_05100 [Mycolicibacter engbaekii]|uniref:Uncharacterized protein n=1 Tax=Mycolicibacter engbaekii TaxID=188915 RepID=A0A1X1U090_9MYCO|nr:hypothetical protein AWC02_05100 [Mycolicibacter engbaekii]
MVCISVLIMNLRRARNTTIMPALGAFSQFVTHSAKLVRYAALRLIIGDAGRCRKSFGARPRCPPAAEREPAARRAQVGRAARVAG